MYDRYPNKNRDEAVGNKDVPVGSGETEDAEAEGGNEAEDAELRRVMMGMPLMGMMSMCPLLLFDGIDSRGVNNCDETASFLDIDVHAMHQCVILCALATQGIHQPRPCQVEQFNSLTDIL